MSPKTLGVAVAMVLSLAAAGAVTLGGLFSMFSPIIIACTVKTRESFMGVGQLPTMPLFFASNAVDPPDLEPDGEMKHC